MAVKGLEKNIAHYWNQVSRIEDSTSARFLSLERRYSTDAILTGFKAKFRSRSTLEQRQFGYFAAGHPIGLVSMKNSSHISLLLTHPGSECVGGILKDDQDDQGQYCLKKYLGQSYIA